MNILYGQNQFLSEQTQIWLDNLTGISQEIISRPVEIASNGNLEKKSKFQMGFEPTTLHDLVGCSRQTNHSPTGDYGDQLKLQIRKGRGFKSHLELTFFPCFQWTQFH